MELRERAVGSILGLALGDALGAPFEARRHDRIPSPIPAFELPWMGSPPGTSTDDTAMARILVRSLIEHDGDLDVGDVRDRLVDWLETDPRDVGTITRRVLTGVRQGSIDAARDHVEQRGPEVSADNGSVKYCAPLGVVYARRPDRLGSLAPQLSAITHWDGRCRTACLAVTLAVASLVRGEPASDAVAAAVAAVADREGGEELEYLVEEAGRARPVDGPDMGFALFTAGIALQAAVDDEDVEGGLRRVVSLGGDTGTNAAVAGALLGAAHGLSALPRAWLRSLADREAIEQEAERLADILDEVPEPRAAT